MSTLPENGFYRMSSSSEPSSTLKIGRCIILNYENFSKEKVRTKNGGVRLVERVRTGTKFDVDALMRTFTRLKFDVKVFNDLNRVQTKCILDNETKFNHSQYYCFAFCILSHGTKKQFKCIDNEGIDYKEVYSLFDGDKCLSLSGKPKLFFIQTCQGSTKVDLGHRKPMQAHTDEVHLKPKDPTIIPNKADLFKFVCCYSEHFSLRNPREGSWFIQELCNVFDSVAHQEDLGSMVTQVTQRVGDYVAELVEDPDPLTGKIKRYTVKQVPQSKSTLRWKIKFNVVPPQ